MLIPPKHFSILLCNNSRETISDISFSGFCVIRTFSQKDYGRSPFFTYLLGAVSSGQDMWLNTIAEI
jgi:hypothetical protein